MNLTVKLARLKSCAFFASCLIRIAAIWSFLFPQAPLSVFPPTPMAEAYFPTDQVLEDPSTGSLVTVPKGTPTKLTTSLKCTPEGWNSKQVPLKLKKVPIQKSKTSHLFLFNLNPPQNCRESRFEVQHHGQCRPGSLLSLCPPLQRRQTREYFLREQSSEHAVMNHGNMFETPSSNSLSVYVSDRRDSKGTQVVMHGSSSS